MVAAKGIGLDHLLTTVAESSQSGKFETKEYLDDSDCIEKYMALKLPISGQIPVPYSEKWMAVKLIERDSDAIDIARENIPHSNWKKVEQIMQIIIDGPLLVASARYNWIQRAVSGSLNYGDGKTGIKKKSRFDLAATHSLCVGGVLLSEL